MQIVIDIDENVFTRLFDNGTEDYAIVNDDLFTIAKSIRKGTPLPEHHGRLIDADELYGDFIDGTEGYDCNTWNRIEIGDIIEDAPTIIEADKESEDADSD